jgi:hypothetical protein
MAISDYRDFVLVAEDVEQDDKGAVKKFSVRVFDSPVGQGEQKEIVTVPDDLLQRVHKLETRQLDQDVKGQMELGEILAALLLPPYARQLFGESLTKVRERDEGLRLRLRLADELADLPWEYAYIQDAHGEHTSSGFLALDPRISIVRHEALAIPGDWFKAPAKRRIVVAAATPEPHSIYPHLTNLPQEQKAFRQALGQVPGVEAVFLPDYDASPDDRLPGATPEGLLAALMERTDVFHFSGHGEFVREGLGQVRWKKVGAGGIILADEENQAQFLPADNLAETLRSKGVRLVVLGACETGRRDGHNVWSSVATSLLKAGIPAVVAMQFKIKDTLAVAFGEAFYGALVAGLTIDEAVALGREAIRLKALEYNNWNDIRDWGTPVLYLRAPGGRVFNPVSDKEAQQKAKGKIEELKQVVRQDVSEVSSTGYQVGAVARNVQDQTIIQDVEQIVKESMKGVMIGSMLFNVSGGEVIVHHETGVVEGTMIGSVVDGSEGGSSLPLPTQPKQSPQLEDLLGVVPLSLIVQQVETVQDNAAVVGTVQGDHAQIGGERQYGDVVQGNKFTGDKIGPEIKDSVASTALAGSTCPHCGQPVQAGWKFCAHCQTRLATISKHCPYCGTEVAAKAKFCHKCGKPVG